MMLEICRQFSGLGTWLIVGQSQLKQYSTHKSYYTNHSTAYPRIHNLLQIFLRTLYLLSPEEYF